MPVPVDVIQLEPHDDVVSVRDRLSFVGSRRILLVWPPGGEAVLRRKLDLVLLQREASRRGARMALVTRDRQVIDNARDLNISTFPTIADSRRQRWKRGRSKVFVTRADRPDSDIPYELQDVVTRRRAAPTASQVQLGHIGRAVAVLGLVAVLLAAMILFVPSATIVITPARQHLDVTIRVVADPSAERIDLERGVIPATVLRVEIEDSATVDTTGTQNLEPTLATGIAVFTNQTQQAVTIPAGTTVNTSTGAIVRFRTLEPVNIAGENGAIAAVAIEALPQFAGPIGNVPAFAINYIDGPLNDILTVQNPDPTSGGANPIDRTVAQADHDRLLAAVRGAIQQRALASLTALLGERQQIVPESIRIAETRPEWTSFSAAVGDTADTVSLTMRAAVEAVVLDERLVNQVAYAGLAGRIPSGQIVVPDSMAFSQGEIELIDERNRVVFRANVTADTATAVDSERIRRETAGLSLDAVREYLTRNVALDPALPPSIAVWPPFFDRMPVLPGRISVTIQGRL